MNKFRIAMTDAEEAIVARIDFGEGHGGQRDRHAAYLANREPILELLESLTERRGIPAHRLGYWNEPEFNPGRVKGSRKQMFERHGTMGREIYTHPNFVRHLRYILFGAELPESVMVEFESEVGNPEWVSYGDALELGKFARRLVRTNRLAPHEAGDEFFKLSLDLGLSVDEALRIREIVRETR